VFTFSGRNSYSAEHMGKGCSWLCVQSYGTVRCAAEIAIEAFVRCLSVNVDLLVICFYLYLLSYRFI
jgi:hypothetical protein